MEISRARLGLPQASCQSWLDIGQCMALSEPVIQDLCIVRGDTGFFMIIVTEHDGVTPIDITSAVWDADIRVTYEEAAVGYFEVAPYPGQPHIAGVTLLPVISERLTGGPYIYDVQMNLNGVVTTLVAGTLTASKDVSR
jgi:hypothetical protein